MSRTNLGACLLLVGCIATLGCSERTNREITASAAAEVSSDGSVKVRKATASEKTRLEEGIKRAEAIDERFPGSAAPRGAPTDRVTEISVPGILKLQSGRSAQLDGVSCNEEAVGYLRRMLEGSNISVVILPSVETTTQPFPAEVWSIDSELQVKGITAGPGYSNIVETAIKSGWCKVEATPTSKHNDRYAALAQAFQNPPSAR